MLGTVRHKLDLAGHPDNRRAMGYGRTVRRWPRSPQAPDDTGQACPRRRRPCAGPLLAAARLHRSPRPRSVPSGAKRQPGAGPADSANVSIHAHAMPDEALRLTATELHRQTGSALRAVRQGRDVQVVDRFGDVVAILTRPGDRAGR